MLPEFLLTDMEMAGIPLMQNGCTSDPGVIVIATISSGPTSLSRRLELGVTGADGRGKTPLTESSFDNVGSEG
jgi:hypothetical protein